MSHTLNCKRRTIGSRRFEIDLDAQVVIANGTEPGFEGIAVVRNLSMRGALIETHARMKANDQLRLYLTLPNQPDELEISNAEVRWVRERQVGIEFLKLNRKTSQVLMRYLSSVHITKQTRLTSTR